MRLSHFYKSNTKFISFATLKRKLKMLNLTRRKNFSKLEDVVNFIDQQLQSSSQLHGYRWMHLKCIQNGFVVTQKTVRLILKEFPDSTGYPKYVLFRSIYCPGYPCVCNGYPVDIF